MLPITLSIRVDFVDIRLGPCAGDYLQKLMPHLQEHCRRDRSQSLKEQKVLFKVRVDLCFGNMSIPERKRELGNVFVCELSWGVCEEIAVLIGVQGLCKRGQVFAVELER